MQRSAGILLPISSLPSPYGIGCFSQEAYDFVDWLKEAGQTYWQILPLGVTSYGDSPYLDTHRTLQQNLTRFFVEWFAKAEKGSAFLKRAKMVYSRYSLPYI